MHRLLAIGACLTLGATVGTQVLGAALDLRTGLWEMTSAGEATGMPPIPPEALARLPPEQRAQMQERMGAVMGQARQPHVERACITEKILQRGMDFHRLERPDCKRTVANSSSRQLDVRVECTGDHPMNGTFHMEAVDRQTMRGSFDIVVGNMMTMKRSMQGRWLGADCGSVKPPAD